MKIEKAEGIKNCVIKNLNFKIIKTVQKRLKYKKNKPFKKKKIDGDRLEEDQKESVKN